MPVVVPGLAGRSRSASPSARARRAGAGASRPPRRGQSQVSGAKKARRTAMGPSAWDTVLARSPPKGGVLIPGLRHSR